MVKTTVEQPPIPRVKAFNCLSCGSTLQIRAEGLSQVVACSSCKTVNDVSSEVHAILSQSKHRRLRRMVIPLGTRGKIHGSMWEVIGYMERTDTGSYSWSEYLLFNPMKGFRWLSENNGHWSYVLMIKQRPNLKNHYSTTVEYGGHWYKLFHKGLAEVAYIEGEFYWRAKVGDRVSVLDFIRDNEMLSMEKSKDETVWAVSEYILSEDIQSAFKIKEMPPQYGVAPNQPCKMSDKIKVITDLFAYFVVAIFVLQLFHVLTSKNQLVHREMGVYDMGSNPSAVRTSQVFVLDDQNANVQVKLYADVNNSWLWLQGELVKTDFGDTEEFDVGVEYYSGYDGEHWSEGTKSMKKNIPSISGGTYHLNYQLQGDRSGVPYEISVYRDVPLWRPFLWTLFWLSIWPLYLLWRRRSFNVQKWSNSDYSPYAVAEDE